MQVQYTGLYYLCTHQKELNNNSIEIYFLMWEIFY